MFYLLWNPKIKFNKLCGVWILFRTPKLRTAVSRYGSLVWLHIIACADNCCHCWRQPQLVAADGKWRISSREKEGISCPGKFVHRHAKAISAWEVPILIRHKRAFFILVLCSTCQEKKYRLDEYKDHFYSTGKNNFTERNFCELSLIKKYQLTTCTVAFHQQFAMIAPNHELELNWRTTTIHCLNKQEQWLQNRPNGL